MASEQEDKSKVGFFNTIHWLTHLLLITCCSQIFHLCYIFFKYRHVDGKEKGVEFISTQPSISRNYLIFLYLFFFNRFFTREKLLQDFMIFWACITPISDSLCIAAVVQYNLIIFGLNFSCFSCLVFMCLVLFSVYYVLIYYYQKMCVC